MTDRPSPFPHQVEGVRRALRGIRRDGGYFLAMGVGTGKTRTAIGIARHLDPPAWRVLVLAPVVALGVWEREIAKWEIRESWTSLVIRGNLGWDGWRVGTAKDAGPPSSAPPRVTYCATNYEQLVGPPAKKRLAKLVKWSPDLVILDESHWIKNPTSQRTRAVRRLCRGRRVLALSGTPAHTPLDWWAQYSIVAPANHMWSGTFSAYRSRVAIMGGPDGHWPVGYRQDEIDRTVREGIAPHTYTVPTSALNLPEPIESVIPLTLSESEKKVYASMEADFLADLGDGVVIQASNGLAKLGKLQQITGGFLIDEPWVREVGGTKRTALLDLLVERQHLKVVIACRFRYDIQSIADQLRNQRRLFNIISGDTPPHARTQIEDDFQASPDPRILIIQARAGGVAITLSKANSLIIYSQETSVIVDQQLRGRVWRPGQTGHVEILTLVAEDTVDEDIYAGLRKGKDGVDLLRLIAQSRRVG